MTALSETIADVFERHSIEWRDYGLPSPADVRVAIAAMLDYIESETERTQMELPAANLKIVQDAGEVEIWVKIGVLYDQPGTDEQVELPED